jgi:hypothetical protein
VEIHGETDTAPFSSGLNGTVANAKAIEVSSC